MDGLFKKMNLLKFNSCIFVNNFKKSRLKNFSLYWHRFVASFLVLRGIIPLVCLVFFFFF
jgi:hypothetical protein